MQTRFGSPALERLWCRPSVLARVDHEKLVGKEIEFLGGLQAGGSHPAVGLLFRDPQLGLIHMPAQTGAEIDDGDPAVFAPFL